MKKRLNAKIFQGFAEYCWTAEIEGDHKLNKRMAPQVGLESTTKRSFNDMQSSG